LLSRGVGEEFLDGFLERWDVRANHTNLPRRRPGCDDRVGRFPRRDVQRFLDPFTAERSLDPDRTLAATVTTGCVRAGGVVPAKELSIS
jgi:hypothetical protein